MKQDVIEDVLHAIAKDHNVRIGSLMYNFVPREKIIEINSQFLNHHYATDIITFDYVDGKMLNGEIFICAEEVYDNATHFNVLKEHELIRVIVHGVLHLAGYKDATDAEKERMRSMEDKYLILWKEGADGTV